MKRNFIFVTCFLLSFTGSAVFSQQGESGFKQLTIHAGEASLSECVPVIRLGTPGFSDQDQDRKISAREQGQIWFYIQNAGPASTPALVVNVSDSTRTPGLVFETPPPVKPIDPGDSVKLVIPLSGKQDLGNGRAVFLISLADNQGRLTGQTRISIPTREEVPVPLISWTVPSEQIEKTDFPVFEIAGRIHSPSRLSDVRLYINGLLSEDNNNFVILPTADPQEFLLKRSVALEEGYNEIRIEARNGAGTSMSDPRVIRYETTKIDQAYREKRLALVIGNANYVHGNVLSNPLNDARAFSAALEDLGFKVLTYLDANQKTLKMAIDEFGELLKDYNVGLFYYAGHGIQVKGDNYLIPVDADLKIEQDVDYDCIDVGRLLGKMEAAETSTNIIILDACRDNPFERSWSGRSQSRGGGLAFMSAPSGSLIAYATSPGKTASDGSGKNGLYTEALLQFINIPGLPIEEFFKNVRTMVEQRSNGAQTPWESTSLKGNFYFKLK